MDINSMCLQNPVMAENNSPPPNQPRKRRRPALSCVQCRRRKIKCDRNMPCGQCTSSKTSACLYASDPAPPSKKPRVDGQLPPTPSSIGQESPGNTSGVAHGTENTEGAGFPLTTSSVWAMRQPVIEGPKPSRGEPTTYSPAPAQSDQQTVQALLDRVHKLERMLSEPDHKNSGLLAMPLVKTPGLRGAMSKTRFFGQSHWVNSFEQFKQISNLKEMDSLGKKGEVFNLLHKCKAIGRTTKANRAVKPLMPTGYRESVPEKETADRLVAAYFRTFESAYRILHIPTFEEEYEAYWKNPTGASIAFVVKLLLVMAIGSCFYEDSILPTSLHSQAPYWIQAAQSWLTGPGEKHRLNMTGLQIYCLLLLARQTNSVGADIIWISTGSVYHLAMSIGLHRDPTHFPKIGPFQTEMRRRLWATVLELSLQSSSDLGMAPLFSPNDYNTELPSNVDDADLTEDMKTLPQSKPVTTFTQTSIQLLLMKTFYTRLEIAKTVNSFRNEASYEDTIRLGSTLTNAARSNSALLQSFLASSSPRKPTPFHIKLHDFYTTHWLLSIHRPYAIKAKVNPTYYFSRKVCLETALSLLAPAIKLPQDAESEKPDDWDLYWWTSSGVTQGNAIVAYCSIALELIQQLEEEPPLPLSRSTPTPQQAQIFRVIQGGRDWARNRILRGETNVKGHVFASCLCGQIEAMQNGTSTQEGIVREAQKSVEFCYQLLKDRLAGQEAKTSEEVQGNPGVEAATADIEDVNWEVMMQDANMSFEIPDEWIFSGWEDSSTWA
ncbi:C6 zinc finger domain-containing protein [Rutstroemia sp. NJR-2017a BBW]|nr:C6 zinc finger domain-containing protein [Rutstroemia sp. NJR-2017a BBW]